MPPVYEALLLNTVVPQIQAAQAGDSYVMVVNATTPALRITQTGTGDAILVEDSANPDATPFVVLAAGDVGIGTNAPLAKLHVAGEARFVSGAATQPAITITQGFINADISSANFTIGNFGDNSSEMRVATRGFTTFFTGATNNSTGTERMRLDSSGNLGLGVTPSPWGTDYKAIQIGGSATGALSYKNFVTSLSQNVYSTNANDVALVAGNSAKYELNGSGEHVWKTATAVTANTTTITNGVSYTIITSGNQTAFGAANNNVGTSFTATSSGTLSSGTVSQNISFTQAMTLDASGNLIIGDTSGTSTLNLVRGGSDSTEIKLKQTGTGGRDYRILSSGSGYGSAGNLIFYDATASAERARITSGGYFKASNTGTYVSSAAAVHELRSNADNNNTVIISSDAASGTQYGLSIRTTNDQNDATRDFLECQGGGTLRAQIRSNGGLANYSANDVNLASDERLKKDISPLANTWSRLKAVEVVNFRYKDCNEGDPLLYGVIAQQVQPIVPELVVVTKEAQEAVEAKDAVLDADGNVVEPAVAAKEATPEYYGIREQPMYWLAIKALQEAMARIETLEAEVAALKGA